MPRPAAAAARRRGRLRGLARWRRAAMQKSRACWAAARRTCLLTPASRPARKGNRSEPAFACSAILLDGAEAEAARVQRGMPGAGASVSTARRRRAPPAARVVVRALDAKRVPGQERAGGLRGGERGSRVPCPATRVCGSDGLDRSMQRGTYGRLAVRAQAIDKRHGLVRRATRARAGGAAGEGEMRERRAMWRITTPPSRAWIRRRPGAVPLTRLLCNADQLRTGGACVMNAHGKRSRRGQWARPSTQPAQQSFWAAGVSCRSGADLLAGDGSTAAPLLSRFRIMACCAF